MVLELGITIVNYFILLVIVLVGVAFITLIEQKILAGRQIRVGPNYVGYWGLFQPFADAVKLLSKETVRTRVIRLIIYYISPIISLGLSLLLWVVYPFEEGGLDLLYGVLFFICIRGLGVYPILSRGWASNCKYSILGRLRAVAQMVSYEVRLAIIFLSLIWLSISFSFRGLLINQYLVWNIFLFRPLGVIWFVSALAETNRTPYDFAEGESELVSGFNTEYGSGGFTLIFIAEYARILLIRILFSVIFLRSRLRGFTLVKGILVAFCFVWVRATIPRYRYDKLIGLAWKRFLPVTLIIFRYYLRVGSILLLF